jgi:hypothetical protein
MAECETEKDDGKDAGSSGRIETGKDREIKNNIIGCRAHRFASHLEIATASSAPGRTETRLF